MDIKIRVNIINFFDYIYPNLPLVEMFQITLFLIIFFIAQGEAISCKVGRAGCFASCLAQNCRTGYCVNDICSCSGCKDGPVFNGIQTPGYF